ncbi:hypothetical protein RHMOL_Rhmol06G0031900 [Rhododendron molle]|uniref:Uncharacterized protein n=1 Tax=Rhododendron molle TaxID=49168 RepID=A0ACC0N8B9_RHOML|nr:hypothetical protein RHMOL_Rhmol06G0031900 [Rhododendron molle]
MSLLSRLPRKGLLGSSSNGVGKVHISDNGIWTSLRKSPLLLPWWMSPIKDFKNLHSFAPVNYSLQPGNHSQRYQRDGARDLPLRTDNSQRRYLHVDAEEPFIHFALQGADLLRVQTRMVANHVRGCLVWLAFSQDGKIFAELPGTIIRSDGIIATSASCLSALKSKELKVDVRIPDTGETCTGVLLDADFCSNITLVKIGPCEQKPVPTIGKFNCLCHISYAVAAGSSFPHSGGVLAEPRYVPCYKRSEGCVGDVSGRVRRVSEINIRIKIVCSFLCIGYLSGSSFLHIRYVSGSSSSVSMLDRFPVSEIEKTESHNAFTSGQTIEAEVDDGDAADIGGCLVDPKQGVVGIIHYMHGSEVKATPIDIVFKTLEDIEMHRRIYTNFMVQILEMLRCGDVEKRGVPTGLGRGVDGEMDDGYPGEGFSWSQSYCLKVPKLLLLLIKQLQGVVGE